MIKIKNVISEEDYRLLLRIESQICRENPSIWHLHFGGIGFNRYFLRTNKDDIFHYGKLVYSNMDPVGYALLYVEEREYYLSMIPTYQTYARDVVLLLEYAFQQGKEIHTSCNNTNYLQQLKFIGYRKNKEDYFQAAINLHLCWLPNLIQETQKIHLLCREDLHREDVLSDLSSFVSCMDGTFTKEQYQSYLLSNDFEQVLNYIVTDNGSIVCYCSFWMDEDSHTAKLKPVFCVFNHEKDILENVIFYGLIELKKRDFQYVYVDISCDNTPAIKFYENLGFSQCKPSYHMKKLL